MTTAVAGCITGAAISALSLVQRGAAVGNAIRGFFGLTLVETAGNAGVDAALALG